MAVIHRDHLSQEAGRTSGIAQVVVTVGLLLVVLGVLAFIGAAGWGMIDARDGSSSAEAPARLLSLGGLSTVVGIAVAAIGMAAGRRAAGE